MYYNYYDMQDYYLVKSIHLVEELFKSCDNLDLQHKSQLQQAIIMHCLLK